MGTSDSGETILSLMAEKSNANGESYFLRYNINQGKFHDPICNFNDFSVTWPKCQVAITSLP